MRKRPSPRVRLTFAELVDAIDDLTDSPEETTAVIEHLLRSGHVRFQRDGSAHIGRPERGGDRTRSGD